jgi:hypothetical protein
MEKTMATGALLTPASGHQPWYRPINRTFERVFYSGIAIPLLVCVYFGFSPGAHRVKWRRSFGIIAFYFPPIVLGVMAAIRRRFAAAVTINPDGGAQCMS